MKPLHKNNFDFLRLLFAFFVIITHSYALLGYPENDCMNKITNGYPFSYIGVRGFFIISGYLIFKSLIRAKSLKNYFINRLLRLFPALIIVLVLTVLLGWTVSSDTISEYFKTKSIWTYIPKNLMLYNIQYPLAESVFKNNPIPFAVNGSLWTLCYEFSMYIGLIFLFFVRYKNKLTSFLLFLYFLISFFLIIFFKDIIERKHLLVNGYLFFELGIYFIAGSLLASLDFIKTNNLKNITIVASFLFFVSIYFGVLHYSIYFILPILVLGIGLHATPYINNLTTKIGDLSYGFYIFAFPVQQTLIYFFDLEIWSLCLLTTCILFPVSYLSWHCIEKISLDFKYKY